MLLKLSERKKSKFLHSSLLTKFSFTLWIIYTAYCLANEVFVWVNKEIFFREMNKYQCKFVPLKWRLKENCVIVTRDFFFSSKLTPDLSQIVFKDKVDLKDIVNKRKHVHYFVCYLKFTYCICTYGNVIRVMLLNCSFHNSFILVATSVLLLLCLRGIWICLSFSLFYLIWLRSGCCLLLVEWNSRR